MRKQYVRLHAISATVFPPPPPPPPLSLLSPHLCQTPICVCIFAVVTLVFSISGREFFVGLSKRTNQRGAEILADAFKVSVDYGGLFLLIEAQKGNSLGKWIVCFVGIAQECATSIFACCSSLVDLPASHHRDLLISLSTGWYMNHPPLRWSLHFFCP